MPDADVLESTAFVTFYSFKGGVGRSMTLINVAGIMAGRGFKVLAIDMDLEAPGISYLMRHEADLHEGHQLGIVDLLGDACERGEDADLFALAPGEVVDRYSYAYELAPEIRKSEEGILRIMPAGRFDGKYQSRMDRLNLGKLYQSGQGQPLVRAFKEIISDAKRFDFVFIDSRTGFSDESGICTRDLGDYLVVVMGLNRQNEEGTAEFFRSLKDSSAVPKGIRVVLSPVPNGEDELVEKREAAAQASLSKALGAKVDLSLQIPYHPRLALTEEPHIFRRSRGYLYEAYAAVERAVLMMVGLAPRELQKKIKDVVEEKRVDLVVQLLRKISKLDTGSTMLSRLAGGELKELCIEAEAGELREYLAKTLPMDDWVVLDLAETIGRSGNGDARLFYERALEADPSDANNLGNYALFLAGKGDLNEAETMYRRALKSDPGHANNLGNFASFLRNVRRDPDEAEVLYKRALESDPKHVIHLGNFANFLKYERGDIDGAEVLYRRALEIDPKNVTHLGNYAVLLEADRGDFDGAEVMYKRALEIDPKNAPNLGNYATFLVDRRRDLLGAEMTYRSALDADPNHANNLGNYANFLASNRGDLDGAEMMYKRALEADPNNADIQSNYAGFLVKDRGDVDGAELVYNQALKVNSKHVLSLGNYAHFLKSKRGDIDGAKRVYELALKCNPDDAISLGNYAQLLFTTGVTDEAKVILERAFRQQTTNIELQCELYFYALSHAWPEYPNALSSLTVLLQNGGRSKDWSLEENVRVAKEAGHPDPGFLTALADVISDKAPIETLSEFKTWKDGKL